MSVKIIENSSGTIRPSEGYGPILRPTARETYSLRQQIFELVRASGRIARAKIARTLNISPGSVTALTAELISDGFLREVEEISREISRGRPPVALELVPDALYVIGVKLSDEVHTATLTHKTLNIRKLQTPKTLIRPSQPRRVGRGVAPHPSGDERSTKQPGKETLKEV